ncbi:recombinase family protein [Bacillus spongiae]|uniref:recombinase family protein n=1 Tax=Bacillus spongiae TaxID=2683610 RepID=UPI003AF4D1CB
MNLGIVKRTSSGKFILTVMSSFSELDRTLIKEKQQAGIAVVKKTVKEICKITNISEATFYLMWREYKNNLGC